jgi:hypothetical protein
MITSSARPFAGLAIENAPHRLDQRRQVDRLGGQRCPTRCARYREYRRSGPAGLWPNGGPLQRAAVHPPWSARLTASSSMPMTAFIGVRISWLMVARNVLWRGWHRRPAAWPGAVPDQLAAFADVDPAADDALLHQQSRGRAGSSGRWSVPDP